MLTHPAEVSKVIEDGAAGAKESRASGGGRETEECFAPACAAAYLLGGVAGLPS